MIGLVQVRPSRSGRPETPATPLSQVALDIAVLDSDLQDRGKRREHLVDGRRRKTSLCDLRPPVPIDSLNRDRVEPVIGEVREDVIPGRQRRSASPR